MTVVDDALEAALEASGEVVALVGPSGVGKTAAARAVAAEAVERDLVPVRVSPPAGGLDAAASAIASVVSELGGRITPEEGWRTALARAERLLHERDDVVLICDEPTRWDNGGGHFGARARDAVDVLLGPGARWPAIAVDRTGAGAGRVIELPRHGVTELLDGQRWSGFADAARRLARKGLASQLDTPLAQRLAVAIEAWAPDSAVPTNVADLADELANVLAASRTGRRLWAYWQRLALSRVDLPPEMLAELGAARLAEFQRETAGLVLFDGAGRLHDELRRVADERRAGPELGDEAAGDIHRLLFDFHEASAREMSERGERGATAHAAEAQHHAAELSDSELMDLVSFELVDQLNALGTRSSNRRGDHETAAELFLRALSVDDDDAFAQHGRGRALDHLGQQPREVEQRYRRGLSLQPDSPDWHADLVTLLVSLGRTDDARHAWAEAESGALDARLDAAGYDALNIRVATHLIALAELDFAEYVLGGVPEFARDAEWRRLSELLSGRAAADEHGAFVPAPRSGRRWWEERPESLAPRDTEGRELGTWGAGRIESIDDEGAHVHLAEVRPGTPEPVPTLAVISREVWERRCLDSRDLSQIRRGRFVELGRYRGDADPPALTVIRLLPTSRLPEPRHMPLPASRWLSA